MSEQEMEDALDALEAEHIEDEVIDDKVKEDDVEEVKEKPPGYLSHEEWIAKGKDPADYKGENAYKAEYDRIHEIRDLKNSMKQVLSSVEVWQQQQSDSMAQQIEQAKVDAKAELDAAIAADETGDALAAQEKLNKLDSKLATQSVQINPVISSFASNNPIIDKASTQYDAAFHEDMIMIHNGKLDQLLGGDRSRANELTQDQIDRVQKMAFNQTKELHADKFVSPRNKRTSSTQPSKRQSSQGGGDINAKLRKVVGNAKNPRDTDSANEIYEIIKKSDPAAAETFAKNVIGE